MFDLVPNGPWILAWVLVPLMLVTWLLLGWWHCFSSDRETGVLLLFLVACAAWLVLFSVDYRLRQPHWRGNALPSFLVNEKKGSPALLVKGQ